METKFQTSFIPRKPIIQKEQTKAGIGLFLIISIIIFLISVGVAGWVYLEKDILIKSIAGEQNTIETNREGLVKDSITIEKIVELDSRIEVSQSLLDKHISVYPIFGFLEQVTLKDIRFKNFVFSTNQKDSSGQDVMKVEMSGTARDWRTVASQADEFGKSEYRPFIKEPKVSDLSLTQDGSVTFSLSVYFSPDFLSYNKLSENI